MTLGVTWRDIAGSNTRGEEMDASGETRSDPGPRHRQSSSRRGETMRFAEQRKGRPEPDRQTRAYAHQRRLKVWRLQFEQPSRTLVNRHRQFLHPSASFKSLSACKKQQRQSLDAIMIKQQKESSASDAGADAEENRICAPNGHRAAE